MVSNSTVKINKEKCIGCHSCCNDCPLKVIGIEDNKAIMLADECLKCGHCLAICPKNAITIEEFDMNEIIEGDILQQHINTDQLMKHIMLRRSIRKYKNIPVEKEKIKKIIEAGRYTPTARNRQDVRYIVIEKDVDKIEDLVLDMFRKINNLLSPITKFKKLPYNMNSTHLQRGLLFRGAPTVILVISSTMLDGGLATENMELMAQSQGLGTLLVGLFAVPASKSRKIKKILQIQKDEKIVSCIAVGYPDVRYYRSAPKKKANIRWNK